MAASNVGARLGVVRANAALSTGWRPIAANPDAVAITAMHRRTTSTSSSSSAGPPPLSNLVEEFARRTATAVKLGDLYRLGRGDLEARLRMAKFLHKEIAIRNAQLCKELRLLPFGLAETQGTSDVVSWFSQYVDWLAATPRPETAEDDKEFTALLQRILEDNQEVIRTLRRGVLEVREALGEARYDEIRSEVDLILDRFFIKRIGLRFLIQHHIASAEPLPDVSGIIHNDVPVGHWLRQAAAEARNYCAQQCGAAPEVIVIGDGVRSPHLRAYGNNLTLTQNRQFTYVPIHLHYVCLELLKNACTAVALKHKQAKSLPPVLATFSHGEEEVALKVSDEGGGIPRSETHLAWSYFDAPSSTPQSPATASTCLPRSCHAPLEPVSAFGCGLPLARLHARYYGGDLVLKSMEGFGTDAYLFVNRLGQNCEKLPYGVRVSAAQRDSTIDNAASIQLDSLGTVSESEVVFLRRRLQEYREKSAARVFGRTPSTAAP